MKVKLLEFVDGNEKDMGAGGRNPFTSSGEAHRHRV
jgi:hypothetical protein